MRLYQALMPSQCLTYSRLLQLALCPEKQCREHRIALLEVVEAVKCLFAAKKTSHFKYICPFTTALHFQNFWYSAFPSVNLFLLGLYSSSAQLPCSWHSQSSSLKLLYYATDLLVVLVAKIRFTAGTIPGSTILCPLLPHPAVSPDRGQVESDPPHLT